mgnify:CR=1 FL=1
MEKVLEMKGIVKRFPGLVANDHVNFDLYKGEVHALLGENGAGKSTLMSILSGLYQPDEGEIFIRGEKAEITSPHKAIEAGVGMVYQHFMLIQAMTALENIILGLPSEREPWLDLANARKKVVELSQKYNLGIDPDALVEDMSVGEQQRLEIIKTLYRGANILILDEPTNHLDLPSREAVEEALENYDGTLLFVSHDRYFLERIADEIWEIKDKRLERHEMSYREYLEEREGTSRNQDAQRLLLENRLSQLSALLDVCKDEAEKEELNREFIEIARKLRELK